MDPADTKTDHTLAKLEGGGLQANDWSPDEQKILVVNEVSAEESYLWLMDAKSGEKTLLTPKGSARVHYGAGQFNKDGKGIYVTTDKDSEFHRLAYIDLASKQHAYLSSSISWNVDEFDLSDNGSLLSFLTSEHAFCVLPLLHTTTRTESPVPALAKGVT